MIGATLYLVCVDYKTKELVPGTNPCAMCKRLIINAGIQEVIVRDNLDDYRIIPVTEFIEHDDSLEGKLGY